MPPRYSYWTIIAGGLPTAFRAAEREELLPTYTRLREKHPDAEMRWFARGKLWESPDAARHDLERERGDRSRDSRNRARNRGGDRSREGGGDRPVGAKPQSRSSDGREPDRAKRDHNWRPGGEHRDPRQKYADAKKARNVEHRRQKFARKHGFEAAPGESARRERPGPKHGDRVTEHRGPAQAREGRPAAPKHWRDAREGGPAAPKRRDDWREGRPAPPKHWRDAREGGPAAPKRRDDWREGRPAPPKRWHDAREGGPAAPKRRDDWREGRPAPPKRWHDERKGGSAKPPRWTDSRERGPAPAKRWPDSREGERPSKPDWRDRQRNAGAPKRDRRDNLPASPKHGSAGREGAPSSPKRRDDWRDGGARGGFVDREDRPRFSGKRPFERRGFERNQGTDEPPAPPRPRGPNREPRPSETPEPTPPPRPSEPVIAPPGPPERGRLVKRSRQP